MTGDIDIEAQARELLQSGKGDRVGIRILEDGTKVRFFKSNGEQVKA